MYTLIKCYKLCEGGNVRLIRDVMNYIIWEKKHKNIIEMNEYYNYSFITLTNKKLLSLSVSVNCEVLAWDLSCIQLHNVSQIPIFIENTEWWLPEFRVTPNSVSPSFLIWSVCFTVTLDWRLLYLPASWGLFYYHKEINFYVMTSFFIENYWRM